MIDRYANHPVVAYLYIDWIAMGFGKNQVRVLEAPPHGVAAYGHNHVRLAAFDVRHNSRTITLDFAALRLWVFRLVVDANVPAAAAFEVQSGVLEPLAERLARVANERTALIVLLLTCALTQKRRGGKERDRGRVLWGRETDGLLDSPWNPTPNEQLCQQLRRSRVHLWAAICLPAYQELFLALIELRRTLTKLQGDFYIALEELRQAFLSTLAGEGV